MIHSEEGYVTIPKNNLCSYFYETISKKQLSEGGKKKSMEQDVCKSIIVVIRKIGVGWGAHYA